MEGRELVVFAHWLLSYHSCAGELCWGVWGGLGNSTHSTSTKINDDLHTLATLTGVVVPPELERAGGREKKRILLINH